MKVCFGLALVVLSCLQVRSQSIQDSVALEAFMDGVIQMQLNDKHIVGATITIVKDGKVILSKGYGFSDQSKQTGSSRKHTLQD